MRNLDRMLTDVFSEDLKKVPPALVDKKAVAARTFEKLGLEQPINRPTAQEEWATPVTRRHRPWAVLAACLMLAVIAGVGISLRPMLTAMFSQEELSGGTYLECTVTDVSFDTEKWAVVFDLEAKTDLDLDHPDAATGYDFTAYVTQTIGSTRKSMSGLDQEALAHWTEAGEDTYRCENVTLEIDPVFQAQNRLTGEQDLDLQLFVYFGEKNPTGTREEKLLAETPFTVDLPSPQDFFTPTTATYFDLTVSDATFDQQNWAIVLTLEAKTDMELDNEIAQQLFYAWFYSLYLSKDGEDVDIGNYAGASLDTLSQWTETGEDTYQSAPVTIPISSDFIQQNDLKGTTSASLRLTVTDLTQGEQSPIQFFPTADFTVELPEELLPGSFSGIVIDSVKIVDTENAPTLGLTEQVVCDLPLDQNPEEAALWTVFLRFTDASGKSWQLSPVEGTSLSWESYEYRGTGPLYSCDPVYFTFPQELSGQEITGHFVIAMPKEENLTESIPEMATAFTLKLPVLDGDPQSLQEEIYDKMLNSVDYFSTARVKFSVQYPGDDHTWNYQIETNLDTGIAHQTLTTTIDPNFSQETYADGSNVCEYDNQAKTVFAAGSIQERRTLEEEWPGLEERYYVDENGDPNYCYRSDPTNTGGANECLFPQEYTFGYLSDKDLWAVEGSVEYCGRQCWDIVGKLDSSYAAQTGADQFRMYVDQETGILLMLDAWNEEDTVASMTVFQITIDDPEICRTFNYDMSPYENYTPLKSSPSVGIIGSADGPTQIHTTP